MKKKNENKGVYISPKTECIEVKLENGFSTSTIATNQNQNINDWAGTDDGEGDTWN